MKHFTKEKLYYLLIVIFIMSCEGEDGQIGSNGEQGESGINSLIKTSNENAGENCQNGGLKIETGLDSNSNGILEENEIQSTNYTCNGINGDNSLTTVTSETSGENCQNGGVKINSGLDTNNNGVLEENEITTTAYVCNGIDGNTGITKINSENSGVNCENGGIKIEYGLDINNDGILNIDEITYETYVCNGVNGDSSLVKITEESDGENCENGGIKIESGIDNNNNNFLDSEEIETTRYICNGNEDASEQTFINLASNIGNNGTTPFVYGTDIPFFDITTYPNVNSVVFVVSDIKTSDHFFNDIAGEATFELYDLTNDQVIVNSTIISDDITENSFVLSPNIIENIPQEAIILGIRITSGGDFNSRCGNIDLILSRD